jgi:hypothetical protein
MSSPSDFRAFIIEQTAKDSHSLIGTVVIHENARVQKLRFGADVFAIDDGLDRFEGGVALGSSILLAGLGQDAPMPETFSFK